jgi:O-antigen ligase
VILWGYTADQVPLKFWRGTGLNSTKPLDEARKDTWITRPGHVYPERTGQHAHNIFLQTWYELGAFGAAALMLFGLSVLAAIDRLPRRLAPFALATFAGAAALGATSWGFWQPWFMGGYGLAAVALMLALAVAEHNRPAADAPSRLA